MRSGPFGNTGQRPNATPLRAVREGSGRDGRETVKPRPGGVHRAGASPHSGRSVPLIALGLSADGDRRRFSRGRAGPQAPVRAEQLDQLRRMGAGRAAAGGLSCGHPRPSRSAPVLPQRRPSVPQSAADAATRSRPRPPTSSHSTPPLQRGGHASRQRAPAPPRPPARRAHLTCRRWSPPPRPARNRRPWSLTTAQRHLHPGTHKITAAGAALTAHLSVLQAPVPFPALPSSPADTSQGTLVPNWSLKMIKGRSRISPKPPLICDSFESGRQDLNLRPLDPQSSALPSCATSRCADSR